MCDDTVSVDKKPKKVGPRLNIGMPSAQQDPSPVWENIV